MIHFLSVLTRVISVLFFFSACSVNPATLKREFNVIGEEKEIRLGRNASHSVTQSFGGVYDDTDLQKYVNQIGQKIVQVCDRIYLQYQFQVIDSPVLNAFALPGGYIYVTRGLLAELQNEAQLASVLGHEIGHVCARHSAVQLSETLGYQLVTLAALAAGPNAGEVLTVAASLTQTMMLGYSRDREFQADAMGLKYMYKAGYDPKEVSGFLSQLAKKSQGPGGYGVYSSTHPDIFDRIRETRNSAKLMVALDLAHYKIHQKEGGGEAHVTREEVTGYRGNVLEDEYKAHLEGLLYGSRENPRRIHIYTVQESDTIESIADEMFGGDRILAQEIAELNNVEGGAFLQAGTKLKLIY